MGRDRVRPFLPQVGRESWALEQRNAGWPSTREQGLGGLVWGGSRGSLALPLPETGGAGLTPAAGAGRATRALRLQKAMGPRCAHREAVFPNSVDLLKS